MPIKNIILDRDGVINQDSEHYIKSPDEFILINNSIEALFKLYNNKVNIFVATNQSGINRKYYSLDIYLDITNKLLNKISKYNKFNTNNIIQAIYYCPHTPDENCNCRKPKTGMIDKIKAHHNLDLEHTAFIGDTLRDLEAAYNAGCKYLFLVKTGKGEYTNNKYDLKNLFNNNYYGCFADLYSCAEYITIDKAY